MKFHDANKMSLSQDSTSPSVCRFCRYGFDLSLSAGLYLVGDQHMNKAQNFLWTLLEQLLDQIHMCHNHAPAAVSLASKLVHGVSA